MVVINYVYVVVLLVEGDGVLVAEGGADATELAGEAGEAQVAEEVGADADVDAPGVVLAHQADVGGKGRREARTAEDTVVEDALADGTGIPGSGGDGADAGQGDGLGEDTVDGGIVAAAVVGVEVVGADEQRGPPAVGLLTQRAHAEAQGTVLLVEADTGVGGRLLALDEGLAQRDVEEREGGEVDVVEAGVVVHGLGLQLLLQQAGAAVEGEAVAYLGRRHVHQAGRADDGLGGDAGGKEDENEDGGGSQALSLYGGLIHTKQYRVFFGKQYVACFSENN